MPRLGLVAVGVVLACVLAPTAVAKELTNVVVVGAGGRSVVVAPRRALAMTFDSPGRPAPSARAITGPFLLVYPLMEAGVPSRPGRLYLRTQTFCGAWNVYATPQPSDCWRLTSSEARLLAAPRLQSLSSPLPRLLALRHGRTRLKFPGTTGSGSENWGNWLVAIELAFDRSATARRTARPGGCVAVRAVWEGGGRPAAFCVAGAGAWANGLLYPYAAGIAQIVEVLNGGR